MSIDLSHLSKASSNANLLDNENPPNMLSVGDSLMWGQGLRSGNRFRELVRLRLEEEGEAINELSMARSGAWLHPETNGVLDSEVEASDQAIRDSFNNSQILNIYSPADYAREMPHNSLTTIEQLELAYEIVGGNTGNNDSITATPGNASPEKIKWIVLDGGINDVNIMNILLPFGAWGDDFLAGWIAWLHEQSSYLEEKMKLTLNRCLELFPNAVVVVNGYFPIFSTHSRGSIVDWLSVGMRPNTNGIVAALLRTPAKWQLIKTSNTFKWASDKYLQDAIQDINNIHRDRTILFAPSRIVGRHCMFAYKTWLWGFSGPLNRVRRLTDLNNAQEWGEFLINLLPEDEVIDERFLQCEANDNSVFCRLASLGHPNIPGAIDYANSIIEVLELEGEISSEHHRCTLSSRRRRRRCRNFSNRWGYYCVRTEAEMGRACSQATRGIMSAAGSNVSAGGEHASNAAENLREAASCFSDTPGSMADAAESQFSKASDRMESARENIQNSEECWDQTALDIQECDDDRVSDIAECEANHQSRLNDECDIRCNSYTNCSDLGFLRRQACRVARGACVAAAAIARGSCKTGSFVMKETCKAAATAKSSICKGGVVLNNTVCSVGEIAKAAGNTIASGYHAAVGVGAGILSFGSDTLCAISNTFKAGINGLRSGGRFILAIGIAIGGGLILIGCTGLRLIVDVGCRISRGVATFLCHTGSFFINTACLIGSLFTWNSNTITNNTGRQP